MNEEAFQQLGLTKSESKIANALYLLNGDLASVDYLLNMLYSKNIVRDMKKVIHDHKNQTLVLSGTRTLRVFISKIRRKLGIDVDSKYNNGYCFSEITMKRLDVMLGVSVALHQKDVHHLPLN